MNDTQLKALARLVLLMDGDEVAQAEATAYGDWFQHATDYLADLMMEEMN